MELSGRIKVLLEANQVSSKFRKRELVLTTEGRYPQQILIEFTQDKIDLLNGYKVGDEVRIQIDIRGREWNSPRGETKYFVSIQGWRIEALQQGAPAGGPPSDDGPPPWDAPVGDGPDGGGGAFPDDDIPF